jgi:hypothetical protein
MISTFGPLVLFSGVGGFPHEPTDTATSRVSGAAATVAAEVLLLISASGMLRATESATPRPVNCCPLGNGAWLKKWSPVVCTAQVV